MNKEIIKRPLKLLRPQVLKGVKNKISSVAYIGKNTTSVSIFTDGSCLENDGEHPGTYGIVVILNGRMIYEYSGHNVIATNNSMELSAMIIASQLGQYLSMYGIHTVIKSDSQYALETLYGPWRGKANKDLQEQFKDLNISSSLVSASWVKSHNGDVYNELVDKICLLEYNHIEGYNVTKKK